jgi:hypothetical protein
MVTSVKQTARHSISGRRHRLFGQLFRISDQGIAVSRRHWFRLVETAALFETNHLDLARVASQESQSSIHAKLSDVVPNSPYRER